VKGSARVLGAPAALAALDLLCRLAIADLLALNHDPAARIAALYSAILGVLKDLLLVMPAYGLFALVPRTWTLLLTHVVLFFAVLILVGDFAYFYFTLEHVEPVLFVNLNLLSMRGTLDLWVGSTAALVVGGAGAFVWLNARLLKEARPCLARRATSVGLLAACLLPALPLVVSNQPEMPLEASRGEKFLNQLPRFRRRGIRRRRPRSFAS
jgi:hypothetical protein